MVARLQVEYKSQTDREDQIAWLFNLRGSDISYNPVLFAYVIVTTDSIMFVGTLNSTIPYHTSIMFMCYLLCVCVSANAIGQY